MPHRYLHISSKDRRIHEHQASFQVNLNSPIDNVVSVGVSRFTIANSFFNVTENNNKLEWLENTTAGGQYVPTTSKLLSITIPTGNYQMSDLLNTIQNEFIIKSLSVVIIYVNMIFYQNYYYKKIAIILF